MREEAPIETIGHPSSPALQQAALPPAAPQGLRSGRAAQRDTQIEEPSLRESPGHRRLEQQRFGPMDETQQRTNAMRPERGARLTRRHNSSSASEAATAPAAGSDEGGSTDRSLEAAPRSPHRSPVRGPGAHPDSVRKGPANTASAPGHRGLSPAVPQIAVPQRGPGPAALPRGRVATETHRALTYRRPLAPCPAAQDKGPALPARIYLAGESCDWRRRLTSLRGLALPLCPASSTANGDTGRHGKPRPRSDAAQARTAARPPTRAADRLST